MSDERLRRWLEAEGAGRADEAEAVFSALFAEKVPVLVPSGAFTARVMDAALSARPWDPLAWRWVRVVGATAALLMGLVLLAALSLDPFAVLQVFARAGAALVTDARAVVHAVFATGLTAWTVAASVGRAMLIASSSGLVPFVLVANLLLALASSYGLRRLMAPREECP
ncbi:MAG: hypothetical protein EHM24_15175 [Acidobacteria bacterium]|nr:MAG: hypothetical protein EHM24_15175 [Acidobacteriota bacterium]